MRQKRSVRIASASIWGVEARPVEIEVTEKSGHGAPRILGLADAGAHESLHRIRAVFEEESLPFPRGQIVVNLAPAHARKDCSGLDLPLALALAALAGVVEPRALATRVALGELSLDGRVRPVAGAVAAAVMAREGGWDSFLCAAEDGPAAARVPGLCVETAETLEGAILATKGSPGRSGAAVAAAPLLAPGPADEPALGDVRGQESAKRALLAAAAGGHNLLLLGPPGCGKTFLARRLPPLMPRLSEAETIEVLRIHSAHGRLSPELFAGRPPFRAPHHTASFVGIVGGGVRPRPGEVTLAHRGVLFLDELAEFRRDALEALRQPLEEGRILISRAGYALVLPARFLLVAAMNPCPCGFLGHATRPCVCSPDLRRRYRSRISGPLLDRIDLQVEMHPPSPGELLAAQAAPGGDGFHAAVTTARAAQEARHGGLPFTRNAEITDRWLPRVAPLDREARRFLEAVLDRVPLSARALGRVRRVARTLADLAGRAEVAAEDLAEAVQFRGLDLSVRAG